MVATCIAIGACALAGLVWQKLVRPVGKLLELSNELHMVRFPTAERFSHIAPAVSRHKLDILATWTQRHR